MVNLRSVLLICLCLLSVAEANLVEDLFNIFFRPIWNLLVQGTCNSIAPNFNDGFRLGCKCRGIYNSGAALEGLGGELRCQNDADYCIINRPVPLYCGNVDLEVAFNARQGPSSVLGCFNVKSGLPLEVSGGELPRVCASLVPSGPSLNFASCEITFDNEVCNSCEVCESQRDIKFNCSNIDVGNLGLVPGPTMTECQGFSFLSSFRSP